MLHTIFMYTTIQKIGIRYDFFKINNIFLINSNYIIKLQIFSVSNKCYYFEFSIHQRNLKNNNGYV